MNPAHKLVELESLSGFRVAADESDPRGWAVISCDGDQVGIVRTMLVDTELLKARYFVTALANSTRTVLLPVPLARLDNHARRVIFDVAPLAAFSKLPDYLGNEPTQEEDDAVHLILIGTGRPGPITEASVDRREASADRRHASRRTGEQ
jgi:hypothetical protein